MIEKRTRQYMSVNRKVLETILNDCKSHNAQLVAVTKYRNLDEINELYECGLRKFGENKAQEFIDKQKILPSDIEWHFIGHLQSNKVKMIIDKVAYIHSVDSIKLANTINKEAKKINKIQNIFIQIHLAEEITKYGFELSETIDAYQSISQLENINVIGLMTMGTNTSDESKVKNEFEKLKGMKNDICKKFNIDSLELSMGMSSDYEIALNSGSTLVRIGSLLYK